MYNTIHCISVLLVEYKNGLDKKKCFELQIIIIIIHYDAVLCIVINSTFSII